jgi:hypothetical protein
VLYATTAGLSGALKVGRRLLSTTTLQQLDARGPGMVLCRQPVRPPACPLLKSGRGRPNAPDESALVVYCIVKIHLVMLYIGFLTCISIWDVVNGASSPWCITASNEEEE